MDRETQRQNIRNAGATCQADFNLPTSSLPSGRPAFACETAAVPQAFPFVSLTGCEAPLPLLPLSPSGLAVGNDLQTAYCPTAVGYSSTGTIVFSVTAYDQQAYVFFQTLDGITTQQINYLYSAIPSSSAAIISSAIAGNTAQFKNLTKLSDAQASIIIPQIQEAKFLVDSLAVEKARNSLVCQGFNSYQAASCTASAYFGPSAAVPPELEYSPTAASATGSFVVPFSLKSTTGDQSEFTLLNIPGLTAATELANELALAAATRQLQCVYENDEQWASCCTAYPNNLGYDYCVPNDILPVLPSLSPRVGETGVPTGYVFSSVSKAEANSLAAELALSRLNCYFVNEDSATSCSDDLVASSYPINFNTILANWSSTAGNVIYIPYHQPYEIPLNTRLYFSGAKIPGGLTADQLFYATSITGYSIGTQIKISSSTASHLEYETNTISFLPLTDSGTAANLTVLQSSSPGKYAYILRGELVQTDVSASSTSANALAASILPSYLDCYWGNDARNATCPDVSVTGINGVNYNVPASPSASRVYAVTIEANTIISYLSKLDANQSASAAAELALDCGYCNLRVDPVCTPTAGNLYPDAELPISPSAYIPNCWSINATPGTPPGIICDNDAAAAQNLAISLGGVSLRDQKAESVNCCYESSPVYNTVFCGPSAVRSDSSSTGSLNSQDSFFLPSGTIVICATGEAPPAPVSRFLYTDVWLTNSLLGFCCTGASGLDSCLSEPYQQYYVGNIWGDATQAFSTNAGAVKFYSTSGSMTPVDFSAAGIQGFTAGYVIQSTISNTVARTVITSGGIPTSDTRYINGCPDCPPTLYPFNVYLSHYSPTGGLPTRDYALKYAACSNYSSAPSTTVWASSPSAFDSYALAYAADWYMDSCGTDPMTLASATANYIVYKVTASSTGYTKYLAFETPNAAKPSFFDSQSYYQAYSVTGCYVPYAGSSGIYAAIQNIFCGGPSAEALTLYSDSDDAFNLGTTYQVNSWYSATCGLPYFTPNSGTAYVIGKNVPGVGETYLVFGASGSNKATTGGIKTDGCYGLWPYFLHTSEASCDVSSPGTTLYANLSNAFTANGGEYAFLYTEPYKAAATYTPATGSYISWVSNTLTTYSRLLSTGVSPANRFEPAISCGELIAYTVYISNTGPADVCSFPWAVGASGITGFNSTLRTLFSKPYAFTPGGPTSVLFYTADNTGPAYIFSNGAAGSTTYLAPYNYCTNFNGYYRAYTNGVTGSVELLTYDSSLHKLAPFQQAGAFAGDNIWEQKDLVYQSEDYPNVTYNTLRIVEPEIASPCQSKAIYSDVLNVFNPFSNYSSSTSNPFTYADDYKKFGLNSSGLLFNDGFLVNIGTCSYVSSNSINVTSTRLGAIFPGCIISTHTQGLVTTQKINYNAYVSSVDLDTGIVSLTGAATPVSSWVGNLPLSVVGFTVNAAGYAGSGTGSYFNCTGPLCSRIERGHLLTIAQSATARQAMVLSNTGGNVYFKSLPSSTSLNPGFTGEFKDANASKIYVRGKIAAELWLDDNKENPLNSLYSGVVTPAPSAFLSATSFSSFIYKDQTEIYQRAVAYPWFLDGSTGSQSGNFILFDSNFLSDSYPLGVAPNSYHDGTPRPNFGDTNIYCAGATFYQAGEIRDCSNGIVQATAWIELTPAETGYLIEDCATGSGTAYAWIYELNSNIPRYYWDYGCGSTSTAPLVGASPPYILYKTSNLTESYYFSSGIITSTYSIPHTYPCYVPSAPSMAEYEGMASAPMFFGSASFFDGSLMAVGSSAGCDVYTDQQADADRIAQELVNSFVRCYYINELKTYSDCPATGGNPAATIKLNDGIVAPGTFVSMISQEDADQIADSVAKSLLVCVTPDQIGGGSNGPSNLDYASVERAYMRRINICDPDGGEPQTVWVFSDSTEFINPNGITGVDNIPVYFAAYRETVGPRPASNSGDRRNYALQKPGPGYIDPGAT